MAASKVEPERGSPEIMWIRSGIGERQFGVGALVALSITSVSVGTGLAFNFKPNFSIASKTESPA